MQFLQLNRLCDPFVVLQSFLTCGNSGTMRVPKNINGLCQDVVMKKLLAPIVFVAALALTGCGGTDTAPTSNAPLASDEGKPVEGAPVEEAPQAPDLTGDWKQSNSQSEIDFMVATIADGAISIDWELGSQDMTAVYWVGTFDAPTDATESHTWTSQRDEAATDTALMASTVDTKEFVYQDGLISYTVSIQGESATVELTKN